MNDVVGKDLLSVSIVVSEDWTLVWDLIGGVYVFAYAHRCMYVANVVVYLEIKVGWLSLFLWPYLEIDGLLKMGTLGMVLCCNGHQIDSENGNTNLILINKVEYWMTMKLTYVAFGLLYFDLVGSPQGDLTCTNSWFKDCHRHHHYQSLIPFI